MKPKQPILTKFDKRIVLIEERRKRNWTQQIVTELLESDYQIKLTRAQLSRIETSKSNPSLPVLIALSLLYQKPIDDLIS